MEPYNVQKKPTYLPLIVGVILTALPFFSFDIVLVSRDSDRFYLFAFHLILRLGVIIWTFQLVKRYEVKRKYL